MTVYNHYEFKHQNDGTTYAMTFEAGIASIAIDNFVSFLNGCGFSSDFIYGYMSEITELHFDIQAAKQKVDNNLNMAHHKKIEDFN